MEQSKREALINSLVEVKAFLKQMEILFRSGAKQVNVHAQATELYDDVSDLLHEAVVGRHLDRLAGNLADLMKVFREGEQTPWRTVNDRTPKKVRKTLEKKIQKLFPVVKDIKGVQFQENVGRLSIADETTPGGLAIIKESSGGLTATPEDEKT